MTFVTSLPKCKVKGDPCISFGPDFAAIFHGIGWVVVACLLLYVAFKLLGPRSSPHGEVTDERT